MEMRQVPVLVLFIIAIQAQQNVKTANYHQQYQPITEVYEGSVKTANYYRPNTYRPEVVYNEDRSRPIYYRPITRRPVITDQEQAQVVDSPYYSQRPITRRPNYSVYGGNPASRYSNDDRSVLCYFASRSHHFMEGQGKFDLSFIEPALQFCTHLVYGYAGIRGDTYKLEPLDPNFDVNRGYYRSVTDLKRRYPGLRVLLSVGGNDDVFGEGDDKNLKYRTLLESVDSRLSFVNSAKDLVKNYGFDGLDLAWEFPETKPKKIRGKISNFFHSLKHSIAGEHIIDEKSAEHREQFTALVRELKNAFRHDGLLLSLSVLPNVNSSVYYEPQALAPNLDFINLMAYDFYNPERNPREADYTAPLYELVDRKPDENADFQVRFWLQRGCPNNKLILGIPTYGRAWKMDSYSAVSGEPPLLIDGPAEAGPYSREPGFLSYPEICTKLQNPNRLTTTQGTHLRKVGDPSKRKGNYAFRLPNEDDEGGIWVSYEDPDSAGNKASYAKARGLGGIAVVDLTMDDFRGLCSGDKFPILRAAKFRL